MATAAPSVPGYNRVFLFRLLTLTIDEGTTLVRNIFDDKRPNVPLNEFLAQEKISINRLRASKTISSVQYDLLFPQSGIAPKTNDFDLMLTVCLLRYLTVFGLNSHFQWNSLPQPADISLEADLRRLQVYRNELAHISTLTDVSETDFNTKWEDIEKVLHRLNASVQNPVQNLQQIIDDCKTRPLDQQVQERYEYLLKWKRDEKETSESAMPQLQQGLQDKIQHKKELEPAKRMNFFQRLMSKRKRKKKENDKYFKNRPDRYDQYLKLLFKGGRFVIGALIEENIKSQNKTLKDILREKEDFVRKQIDNQDQLNILYPSDQASLSMDISTWDIRLLSTVFLQVLVDESVDIEIKESVTEIDEAINFIATSQNSYVEPFAAASDSDDFNECYLLPLYCNIQYLAHFLNIENKKEWETIYKECTTKVKVPGSNQTNQGKSIKDKYEETLKKTRYVLQNMDKHNVAFKNEHVLELKMIAIGSGEEKAHSVEDSLLRIWQDGLGICHNEKDFPNVRKELSKICTEIKKMKDVTYFHVTQPSVILGVASSSPRTILDLLNYFESSAFNQGLSIISRELGYFFNTEFDIEAVITFESLKDILNDEGVTESYKYQLQQTKLQEKYELLTEGEAESSKCQSQQMELQDKYEQLRKDEMSESYKYRSQQLEQEKYEQLKKELKEDLAEFHRDRHSTIPLSPLFEEKDTPLLDFYLMPGMKVVKIERGKEEKTVIQSLSEVYKTGYEFNKEIYVTADSGFGKTAFSKYLTVLWCQAHFPDQKHTKHLEKKSVNVMREFEFIFLVLLRESSDDCSIDDMIYIQVVRNLYRSSSYSKQFMEEILHRERCLVVLDGLDEWTHPDRNCRKVPKSIPHRNSHKNCTYMTTTRPWKLSTTQLKTQQIDKKMELTNLDYDSALELTTRALKRLKGKTDLEMREEARRLFERYHDFEQVSVPLLLMYIICLWCDDIPVAQTKCGLYTSIIELLLTRTIRKYEKFFWFELPQCVSDIPQCFREQEHCKAYFTFLTCLGELAFHTLFSERRENRLVFDSSIAEKCLKEENFLELGRLTGIITQDKQSKLTLQIRKTSFSHKTVQEFFAALYISTCWDKDRVLSFCNSIQDILDLSKVFTFICGINAQLFSLLSNELMEVINKDVITEEYRSTTEPRYNNPLQVIQEMFVSCNMEIPDNKDVTICLQDFFFDTKCKQDNYYTSLQRLAVQNKTKIKSIYIRYRGGRSFAEIIDRCELSDPEIHCQKIYCECKCKEGEIIPLLSNSVKYLHISDVQRDDERKEAHSSLTNEQCKIFHNFSQLETIQIQWSEVSHEFLNYVINVKSIKEITLLGLSCSDHQSSSSDHESSSSDHESSSSDHESSSSDHESSSRNHGDLCPVSNFDLSQHPDLRRLKLWYGSFTFCDMLKDESSLLHKMRNIELVQLVGVKMSSLSLRWLVEIIEKLEHSVRVELENCKITRREEFEDIKDYIRRSESFVVENDRNWQDWNVFEFVTRK